MGRNPATPHCKEGQKIMNHCIGVDVSKNTLDIHFLAGGDDLKIVHSQEEIDRFIRKILPMEPELVVMEATGGYEESLAQSLLEAGLPVAVVNPKRIRNFAKAIGQTAKTDKIDARVIAQYGARLDPPRSIAVDQASRQIKALNVRRSQLVGIRTAEKNRTEHARIDSVAKSIQTVIQALDREIADIDETIGELVRASTELKEKIEIIESFPGIGERTAAALAAYLPEMGSLNRKEIAALTGTAPINRDSGRFRGKRMTGGGRRDIRKLLYMPTLAAIRHNPVIRARYHHLLTKGKEKMVAVVACMRKVLVILNSMVTKKQPWDPDFA
jgi:transposase